MKKNIIKALAATLALTLLPIHFTACQREKTGATLEMNMDNSWRSEKTLQSVSHIPLLAVGNRLLCTKSTNAGSEYILYDPETGKKEAFVPHSHEEVSSLERTHNTIKQMADGNLAVVTMIYQGKGGGMFDIHRLCMEIYDPQLNYIETREMPLDLFSGEYFAETNSCVDSMGNWFYMSYNVETGALRIETFNSEYQKYGEIEPPSNEPGVLFNDADGNVYASFAFYDSSWNRYEKVYKLDAETRTCEETGVSIPEEVRDFAPGTQGYDYYYSSQYGLYGVKDGEITEVMDWINSDFPTGSVYSIYPMESGEFVLYHMGDDAYYLASPRSQEEIDSTKLISLATVGLSEALEESVIDYNRAESGSRIIIKDYGEYNTMENPRLGYETMQQDMLDGIVADMICPDGLHFESLASKGLFADWYDLMDADEEFQREDYLANFFETYEYDGELQRLGVSYTIGTGAAKTEYAGEVQGLSLGEIMNLPLPEGMDRFSYSPAEYMDDSWMITLQTGCINRATAECCFDSPEVVQFLELLQSIPQGDDFYEAEYPSDTPDPWKNDKALMKIETIAQPIDLRAIRRYTFFDADITLVGYPMVQDEGNGGVFHTPFTVSVNAQSKQQAAIWDFMKHLLTEDYQKHLYESMPVHAGALEFKLDEAEGMVTATVGYFPSQTFIGALEEWESDLLREYIYGIRTCEYYNDTVYNILLEETEKMLAGDQSPQECAEMMQSRVSIYLSEQS